MKRQFEGERPMGHIVSLTADGTYEVGTITCDGLESIAPTIRGTTNGSASNGLTLNFYYSPDGKNFDTVAFSSIALDVSAGNATQESAIIDVPDTGHIRLVVSNGSSSYAATDIWVWSSNIYRFQEHIHSGKSPD
jgi:hypothetical protein